MENQNNNNNNNNQKHVDTTLLLQLMNHFVDNNRSIWVTLIRKRIKKENKDSQIILWDTNSVITWEIKRWGCQILSEISKRSCK